MHISKITLVNNRNFANAKLIFNKGINTIIGENGSGKTNLFRKSGSTPLTPTLPKSSSV